MGFSTSFPFLMDASLCGNDPGCLAGDIQCARKTLKMLFNSFVEKTLRALKVGGLIFIISL